MLPAAGAQCDTYQQRLRSTDAKSVADTGGARRDQRLRPRLRSRCGGRGPAVHDARTDASSQAVWTRARPLLTGDLAATAQRAGGAELARPDNRWAMMQQHQAHDVVEHIDRHTDDPVPDTATKAQRQRAISTRAYADDGWNGLVRTTRYWLTLTNTGGAWRVSAVRSTID